MSASIEVPGLGQAIGGLDWLRLDGVDSRGHEIRQLGRGRNAAWHFVWALKSSSEESFVAFVPKGVSKKRPVAAAALIHAALSEDLYLSFIGLPSGLFWLFAVQDGVPVKKMDQIGELADLVRVAKDFLSGLPKDPAKTTTTPIYTDQKELFERLPFPTDVRMFSIEILAESISKADFRKFAFKWHSSAPIGALVLSASILLAACAYWLYQNHLEEEAARNAAKIRLEDIERRRAQLASAVESAVNVAQPARLVVPSYLAVLNDVPESIDNWVLSRLECSGIGCTLTYKAEAFATWNGYLNRKPVQWPAPSFDGDIEQVNQYLPVELPEMSPRKADELPKRGEVRLELGNLAQLSKELGVIVSIPRNWERVAGTSNVTLPDEQWVPVSGSLTVKGSSAYLESFVTRLPMSVGVSKLAVSVGQDLNFELEGKVYANP